MKKLIIGLLLLVCFNGWGQKGQQKYKQIKVNSNQRVITDSTTQYDKADQVYNNLQRLIPTHKLFNRLLLEDTLKSVVWNTDSIQKNKEYGATADHAYGLLYEMRVMSFDTSSVPNRLELMNSVMKYMGKYKFESDEYHYPIGVFDYQYNSMDEQLNKRNGNISLKDSVYYPRSGKLILKQHKAAIIAPLFDLYASAPRMAIVFRKDNFYSNYRTTDDIKSIVINYEGNKRQLKFGETFYFEPKKTKTQKFLMVITYLDGTTLTNYMSIRTPALNSENKEKGTQINGLDIPSLSDLLSPTDHTKCFETGYMHLDDSPNLKLKWCLIPRCGWDGKIFKPYILITGYRPPIVGQSFDQTWEYYNTEHDGMLDDLNNNNYDVFIVKFNMFEYPLELGMIEQSELLEKFILWVNEEKGGQASGQENIIQGSSMGASVARLALLRMEKKHFEDSDYPNHHTRLFNSYDANYYGANLPLSYQALIFSGYHHPFTDFADVIGGIIPEVNGLFVFGQSFMRTYLCLVLKQKATKELLRYHILIGLFNDVFSTNGEYLNYNYGNNSGPGYNIDRGLFLNALDDVDNDYASTDGHTNFLPMPNAPRNIAISLGHYNKSNNYSHPFNFFPPGANWPDVPSSSNCELRVAKHTSNDFLIFSRDRHGFLGIGSLQNKLYVKNMREIDNASGSYLDGAGNIMLVSDWLYFTWQTLIHAKPKYYFTHKPVLSALAFNEQLWPSNGSMTMDMKAWKMMYIDRTPTNTLIPSEYYGYPNLGLPYNHFEVTPFEAVFVGPKIQRHIRLNQDDTQYIDALKGFILREVEPWYLGLQNMHLGYQARSDYRYYSFRRAKHRIIVGSHVTLTTDPGEYTVEPNGKLTLHAGDEIVIKEGTHFKAGSDVHIVPKYEECSNNKMLVTNTKNDVFNNSNTWKDTLNYQMVDKVKKGFKLFPNPAMKIVTIQGIDQLEAEQIFIYNLQGQLYIQRQSSRNRTNIDLSGLNAGIYLVKIYSKGNSYKYKLIVQ